jgi:phosphatidylglycerophosphate synthase
MDPIASILDRLLVNRLVFWLSYTRITPNQITLATGVLGALAAWLFLSGWLPGGILLAYVAATLDGVDGKLARTTLQFSRLGELEHVLDFFMEQAWYLTITVYLAATTGKQSLLWIGGGLMICDLIVKVLYGCGRLLFGKHLEELGHFDRIFRRIGGRRNIYLAILLLGALTGFPQQALELVLAWALLTVAVHMSRMMYHLSQQTAPV